MHQLHLAHHHRLTAQEDAIAAHAELHRAATFAGLEGGEVRFAQLVLPIRAECAVGRAGHRVFIHSRRRGEEA